MRANSPQHSGLMLIEHSDPQCMCLLCLTIAVADYGKLLEVKKNLLGGAELHFLQIATFEVQIRPGGVHLRTLRDHNEREYRELNMQAEVEKPD